MLAFFGAALWRRLLGVALPACLSCTALSQWNLVIVHPANTYDESDISEIAGNIAVGFAGNAVGTSYAVNWAVPNGPETLMPVPGSTWSVATCTDGGSRGGYAEVNGQYQGVVWNSINSPTLLSVKKAFGTRVWGLFSGNYVGTASFQPKPNDPFNPMVQAILWNNIFRVIHLHPPGFDVSSAHAVGLTDQGGWVQRAGEGRRAAFWSGSRQSFRNVHPAGYAASEIRHIHGGYASGVASGPGGAGTTRHAGVWSLAFGGFWSLHPSDPQFTDSSANGNTGTHVVGSVSTGPSFTDTRAAVWDLFQPLGSTPELLPDNNLGSGASSIWTDGTVTYVGGYVVRDDFNAHAAIWWKLN